MIPTIPNHLKYTSSHEWVRLENDHCITMGITHHAQELLGDIVFVELPELNKTLTKGQACGVVESVKAAADVYAPSSGTVVTINETLSTQPELMNTDPYGEGWLCQIQVDDAQSLASLLDAEAYQQNIADD